MTLIGTLATTDDNQRTLPTKESGMVTVLQYRHGEWVIVNTVLLAYLAAVVEPLTDWVAVPARDAESTLNALNYTECGNEPS